MKFNFEINVYDMPISFQNLSNCSINVLYFSALNQNWITLLYLAIVSLSLLHFVIYIKYFANNIITLSEIFFPFNICVPRSMSDIQNDKIHIC